MSIYLSVSFSPLKHIFGKGEVEQPIKTIIACDGLQAHIAKLYKDAGIKQGSSRGPVFVSDVYNIPNYSIPYLEVHQSKLKKMFEEMI